MAQARSTQGDGGVSSSGYLYGPLGYLFSLASNFTETLNLYIGYPGKGLGLLPLNKRWSEGTLLLAVLSLIRSVPC